MLIAAAVAAALSLPAGANAASADDLAQIRDQLQGLMQRVDKLEQENSALKVENETLKSQGDYLRTETKGLRKDAATLASDATKVRGADWATRIVGKGDLRYRYEAIKDPTRVHGGRVSKRIRRASASARGWASTPKSPIPSWSGLQVATGGDDPRSSNQTLGGANSRKSIGFDLAYFDWKFASWGNLIGGKMKYPFLRPGQSLFYDGDINPEGLALHVQPGHAVRQRARLLDRRAQQCWHLRFSHGTPPTLYRASGRQPTGAARTSMCWADSSVRGSRSVLRRWWQPLAIRICRTVRDSGRSTTTTPTATA